LHLTLKPLRTSEKIIGRPLSKHKAQLKRYLETLGRRIEQYLHRLSESEKSNPSISINRSAVENALKEHQQEQKTKEEVILASPKYVRCLFVPTHANFLFDFAKNQTVN